MAVGLSSYSANKLFDAIGNNTSFAVTTCYIQLHTANPGTVGTTAVASNNTRKTVSFGAASGGAISNDVAIEWTNVPASETYSHFSLWDASTVGNFLFSGTITANAVTTGDTFTIAIGDLDLTATTAS